MYLRPVSQNESNARNGYRAENRCNDDGVVLLDFHLGLRFRGVGDGFLDQFGQLESDEEDDAHIIKQSEARYEVRHGIQRGNKIDEGGEGYRLLVPPGV